MHEMSACLTEPKLLLIVLDETCSELTTEDRLHYAGCVSCRASALRMSHACLALRDRLSSVDAIPGMQPQPLPERFEFRRCIGRGASGEIWLANDRNLGNRVAIKMIRRDMMTHASAESLQREGRALAALSEDRLMRRHLVQVHGWEEDEDVCYLVMEYVEGGSLGRRVRRLGPLFWPIAVRYVADVGEVLVEVHRRGILHRDIKPDNILWSCFTDEALLSDFGLAGTMVKSASVGGTKGYLPPEAKSGHCSAASDVFSLGATLYALLTGVAPFAAADLMSSLNKAKDGLPRSDPRLSRVPRLIEEVLRAALEPRADHRIGLPEFVRRLRGEGTHALGESLLASPRIDPPSVSSGGPTTPIVPRLDLTLEATTSGLGMIPSVQSAADPGIGAANVRDLEFVPPDASVLTVADGTALRLRFKTASGGYLTLLNLGSSGKVSILFPNAECPDNRIARGGFRDLNVIVRPPSGTDEAIGILTREPEALLPEGWRDRVRSGQQVVEPYRAYRDLELLAGAAPRMPASELAVAGVKIAHY